MIKINLLPVRASRKREAGKQWLVLFVVVLVASGVGNYIWYHNTDVQVEKVKARVAKYQSDLATLNKIIGEVKNIKDEKAEIEKKLAVLKKLKDNRTGPVKVMDEVATIIPQHVWLGSWEENNGSITVGASAATLEDVSNFMSKLQGSRFFSNVVLKSTHQATENRVDFIITAQVKYSA